MGQSVQSGRKHVRAAIRSAGNARKSYRKRQSNINPTEMSSDVRAMIDARHQAEQRGHFEPLGRLSSIETAHGLIEFGTLQGVGTGPDLAYAMMDVPGGVPKNLPDPVPGKFADWNTLLVLGAWLGLPALRRNSCAPCPKCKHVCEVCAGTGKKQCEGLDCGGRGYTLGKWVSCPGPGCHKDTGNYKQDCVTCMGSDVRGMIRENVVCLMCHGEKGADGFSVMTCSACRGTKKRSTGRVNGSLDYCMPVCKGCGGTGFKGELIPQALEKFANATLIHNVASKLGRRMGGVRPAEMLALGPIHSFDVKDFATGKLRTFDVSQDVAGDFMHLLVPKVARGSRSKAYLVGGVVYEAVVREWHKKLTM